MAKNLIRVLAGVALFPTAFAEISPPNVDIDPLTVKLPSVPPNLAGSPPAIDARDSAFGMKCDGSTDDSGALKAAFDAAARSAKSVRISADPIGAGRPCLLSANVSLRSNTTLWAVPGTVVLKPTPGNISSPALFIASNVSNVLIYGITIDGGGQDFGTAENVAVTYKSDHVIYDHVVFQHTRGIAIEHSTGVTDSGVRDSTFTDIGNHWKTSHSISDRQQALAFCCGAPNNNHGNFAIGNKFTNIGLDAISATHQHDFLASDNVCSLADGQIVATWEDPQPNAFGACVYGNINDSMLVVRNKIDAPQGAGIDLDATTSRIIIGNQISKAGGAGIGCWTSGDCIAIGNDVRNSNQWSGSVSKGGIALSGTLGNVVLSGNVSTDDQEIKTQPYGIDGVPGLTVRSLQIDARNSLRGNLVGPFGHAVIGIVQAAPQTVIVPSR